jgi:phosphate uptake regulator
MNKKQTLADQIVEIDEHINHLQWRCENTINHSELKKLRKTIKGLNKSRLKLSRKLTKGEESHDKIT